LKFLQKIELQYLKRIRISYCGFWVKLCSNKFSVFSLAVEIIATGGNKKKYFVTKSLALTGAALGGAADILFERYEQKDMSGAPDPPFLAGNAQIIKKYYLQKN
jgi:hypothetical protein